MRRALPAALIAAAAGVAAHLLGVASPMVVLLGALAAGAFGGALALRDDRRRLDRGGDAPLAARADLPGALGAVLPVFLGWIVVNVLLNPDVSATAYSPELTSHYSPVLVLLLVVLLAATGYLVVRRAPAVLLRTPRTGTALAAVLLVLLAARCAIAVGLLKIPAFDSGILLLAAYHSVLPAATDNPFDASLFAYYFGIYPNNLPMGWFFSEVFSVAAALGLRGVLGFMAIAIGIGCLALTGVELLTFLTVRRLWGTRAAWLALAVTAVFTVLSPWISTPYSDTIGMLFPIGLLHGWLRLRAEHRPRHRLLQAAGLGAVAAIGVAVKPTVLFAVIAILLVEAVRSRRALRRRATAVVAATLTATALVAGAGTSTALTALAGSSSLAAAAEASGEQALPVTHWMKMGAQGTGGFLFEDVQSTLAEPPQRRSAAALRTYAGRVAAMGPEGYAVFLAQKALRTFADGSFYSGQEGENVQGFPSADPWSTTVRQWFLRDGGRHVYLASLWQAVWVLLLLCAALPVARFAPPARRRAIDVARLSLLALLVFLLLFETRSRYVYLYLPFVVVMATGAIDALPAAVRGWRARLRGPGQPVRTAAPPIGRDASRSTATTS